MNVKHRIDLRDSEIIVAELEDAQFQVSINSLPNLLGTGNILAAYVSEQLAIQAAERFSKMYAIAKEKGYHLDKSCLIKADKAVIPVGLILNWELSVEEFTSQFNL